MLVSMLTLIDTSTQYIIDSFNKVNTLTIVHL